MGDLNLNSEREIYRNIGDQKKQHDFHVLAVDDCRLDRKLLERLLTVSSYQVTFVDSGDEALEYLGLIDNIDEENHQYQTSSSSPKSSLHDKVSKINLIMTDYSMPGISGYDLLKRVKVSLPRSMNSNDTGFSRFFCSKDSSWRDIPVVIMSSENLPSRINMCLEGGAEEFLLKPVKLSDLRKLHPHLNSHRQKQDKDSIKYKENTTLSETRPPPVLSIN